MGWKDQIQVSCKLIIDLSPIDLLLNVFMCRIDESDTARSERLQKWDTFLETGEEKEKEKAEEVEVSEGQSTTINVSQDVDVDDDKSS